MVKVYRLRVTFEVLDGSRPEEIVRYLERHHGDVVAAEVIEHDDEGHHEAGTRLGADAGAYGPWLDA